MDRRGFLVKAGATLAACAAPVASAKGTAVPVSAGVKGGSSDYTFYKWNLDGSDSAFRLAVVRNPNTEARAIFVKAVDGNDESEWIRLDGLEAS